ncbi:hypothetical protein K2P47_01890 [Patescibacteria group bacterium]|nr:hypothetical protein [Patescibacteria group bacterium]
MTNDSSQQNNHQKDSSTVDRLFERIEAESITPTPKIKFVAAQWGLWLVWGLTVFFGAAALAISGYVTMSAQYALYEATHENFLTFMVAIMPYIWLVLFALMTYISVYEIKNTKRGYRYSTIVVLGSNVIFTILGAVLLHCLGLGYTLDQKLGEQIGMYMSLEKREQSLWQKPVEGRLVGILEPIATPVTGEVAILNFKDSTGVLWRLSVDELNERERLLLTRALPVRLLGTTTSDFSFHVCGVFPWAQGRAMPRREMREHRAEFDAMMLDKMEKIEDWGRELGPRTPLERPETSLCATLPIMKRMR